MVTMVILKQCVQRKGAERRHGEIVGRESRASSAVHPHVRGEDWRRLESNPLEGCRKDSPLSHQGEDASPAYQRAIPSSLSMPSMSSSVGGGMHHVATLEVRAALRESLAGIAQPLVMELVALLERFHASGQHVVHRAEAASGDLRGREARSAPTRPRRPSCSRTTPTAATCRRCRRRSGRDSPCQAPAWPRRRDSAEQGAVVTPDPVPVAAALAFCARLERYLGVR